VVQRLILVGPEDLFRALALLSDEPGLLEAPPSLRQAVDEPMETLALGLWRQEGLRFRPTPEGRAWLEAPWRLPEGLAALLEVLPWEAVLKAMGEGRLPLTALLSLFPEGPRGEKAARALAEWGALFGLWEYDQTTEELRPCGS
jgi:hypothetical protein